MVLFLLLKTHRQTGLKYLCKHEDDDFSGCVRYPGSGIRWRKHLKKYGFDVHTECIFATEDKERLKRVAIRYSELLDVENSDEYANLCREEGQGGRTGSSEFYSLLNTKIWSRTELRKKQGAKVRARWNAYTKEEREILGKKFSSALKGLKKSDSARANMKKTAIDRSSTLNPIRRVNALKGALACKNTRWWTDGNKSIRATVCPGESWRLGRK